MTAETWIAVGACIALLGLAITSMKLGMDLFASKDALAALRLDVEKCATKESVVFIREDARLCASKEDVTRIDREIEKLRQRLHDLPGEIMTMLDRKDHGGE